MKYFTSDNTETFISRINSIIDIENKDNLSTHLRQTMLFKDENKVSGLLEDNQFKIWTHEQGRMGMTGIFYPIVVGQFRPLSSGLEVRMSSKMNTVGKIAFILIGTMLAYGILTGMVIKETNDFRNLIPRLLIGGLLFTLMISVPSVIYFQTSKTIKKALIKELGLRNAR